MKKYLLLAAISILSLTSCSNSDSVLNSLPPADPAADTFEYTADITTETFNKLVVGNAWIEDITHEILADGTLSDISYWKDMYGAGPVHYYFKDASSLVSYHYIDSKPTNYANTSGYTFNPSNGTLTYIYNNNVASPQEVTLLCCDGKYLYMTVTLGYRAGENRTIYGISRYRLMTTAEIQGLASHYSPIP